MMKQHPTLLIVDDDAALLRLLEAVSRNAFAGRLDVETCIEPTQALARLDAGGVDILVTDLEMPGLSGIELLRRAKRRNAFVQVLLLTGHSTETAILEAMEHGASDYLLKPVDHDAFVALVEQALARIVRWRQALGNTWRMRREARSEASA